MTTAHDGPIGESRIRTVQWTREALEQATAAARAASADEVLGGHARRVIDFLAGLREPLAALEAACSVAPPLGVG